MSGHRRVRRHIEAYVDGELRSPLLVADVERHLRSCWGCSGDVDDLRLVKATLRSIGSRRPTQLSAVRLHAWIEASVR